MAAEFDPTPFIREPFIGPQEYMPAYPGLYVAHSPEELRPAVAYASELAGVTPRHMLGKTIAYFQLGARTSHIELNKAAGMYDAATLKERTAWVQDAEQNLLGSALAREYTDKLPPLQAWHVLGANIMTATEPEFPMVGDMQRITRALGVILPMGVGVFAEEPTSAQKKALLREYGQQEVRQSSIALADELLVNVSLLALTGFTSVLIKGNAHYGLKHEGVQELIKHIDRVSGPLEEGETPKARSKRVGDLLFKVQSDLERLTGEGHQLRERPVIDSIIEGAKYYLSMATVARDMRHAREATQHEAKNNLQSIFAENTLAEHADLQRPYSFTSNKELRNSPYWPLRTMLTGHSKEKLPAFDPLDQQQATEVAGTLARVASFMQEYEGDPDNVLQRIAKDCATEAALESSYKDNQKKASVGVVPPARLDSIRRRVYALAELWPTIRPAAEKTVLTQHDADNLDIIFAMLGGDKAP